MPLKTAYTEILRLDEILTQKGIDHDINRLYDGYRVGVFCNDEEIGDAIEHCVSYGHTENLLEIRGFNTNDVTGSLTADEVVDIAEKALKEWGNE